jgi:RimJ/RimL family protein N-acetyltransferase
LITLHIARAEYSHQNLDVVLSLIDQAAGRLAAKDTDQWQKPWPDEAKRNERVGNGLKRRKTWIVWDGEVPAGTVTIAKKANPAVWPHDVCVDERSIPAVHVHRLITADGYTGRGLGADMVDWAGRRAAGQYGARLIRIDVWSGNTALHKYYLGHGFEDYGWCDDREYPSGKLFQKRVSAIDEDFVPQFADNETGVPLV